MDLTFQPMSRTHAEWIVSWRYPEPYAIYGYDETEAEPAIDYLTDARTKVFAVLCEGELIAFRSFGKDAQVPGGVYDSEYLDTGGGLRPDLTGKGLGAEIVRKGLEFGARRFGAKGFRVSIAAFNERALTVCKRVGFRERCRFFRAGDRKEFVVLTVHFSPDD